MLPMASAKLIITAMFALSACAMRAQDLKLNYTAVNVADSSQGLCWSFQFPRHQ
jgi:hypothetical protein